MRVPYVHKTDVHNKRAAREVLPLVQEKYDFKSAVDIGSGLCTWLSVVEELGVSDILGVDGDWVNMDLLEIRPECFVARNLSVQIDLKRKFDLAICLEVAEHLAPEHAEVFIDNIVKHSDVVLWSAAIEGQGGQNHLNERNPIYWHELFVSRGFYCEDSLRNEIWNNENVDWWYRQNILIYKRLVLSEDSASMEAPNHLIHPELFWEKEKQIERLEEEIYEIKTGRLGLGFMGRRNLMVALWRSIPSLLGL